MQEEIKKYVGKKALYASDLSLKFEVVIKDFKIVFGRNRYLVMPVKGTGERWVENVTLITNKK
jgi:hypothetical protein